jgi:hypothetical protein
MKMFIDAHRDAYGGEPSRRHAFESRQRSRHRFERPLATANRQLNREGIEVARLAPSNAS